MSNSVFCRLVACRLPNLHLLNFELMYMSICQFRDSETHTYYY